MCLYGVSGCGEMSNVCGNGICSYAGHLFDDDGICRNACYGTNKYVYEKDGKFSCVSSCAAQQDKVFVRASALVCTEC